MQYELDGVKIHDLILDAEITERIRRECHLFRYTLTTLLYKIDDRA